MFQHYRCCGKIPNHQSLPVKVGYAEKELEKPVNTQKFEKQTVIILNIIILNLTKMNLINIYLNKRKGKIGYRREMSIDS
jgi:hypothetical protein